MEQLLIDFTSQTKTCDHCGGDFPPEQLNSWDNACESCEETLAIIAEFRYQEGCRIDGVSSTYLSAEAQFASDQAHNARRTVSS